jgi:hypothetical protein
MKMSTVAQSVTIPTCNRRYPHTTLHRVTDTVLTLVVVFPDVSKHITGVFISEQTPHIECANLLTHMYYTVRFYCGTPSRREDEIVAA